MAKTHTIMFVKYLVMLTGSTLLLSANALELSLQAAYSADYSDNSRQAPIDEEEELTHSPSAEIQAIHNSDAIDFSGAYNIRRDFYSKGTFGDNTVSTGSANLVWQAIPKRLRFHAANARTETTIDARERDIADNRQVTATSSLGATITIDSFAAQYLELGYEYSTENADETDTDSVKRTINAAYGIPLSDNRRFILNAISEDVTFDNDLAPNYTSLIGNLQYVSSGDVLDFDTAFGYSKVDRDSQRNDISGLSGNASIRWYATGISSLSLNASRSLEDNSSDVLQGINEFGERFTQNSNLNEVFWNTDAAIALDTQLGHNTITVSANYRDQDYEDIAEDNRRKGVSLNLSRDIRPNLNIQLFAGLERNEFPDINREDDNYRYRINADWSNNRKLSIGVTFGFRKTESNDINSEFEELSGTITLSYMLYGNRLK